MYLFVVYELLIQKYSQNKEPASQELPQEFLFFVQVPANYHKHYRQDSPFNTRLIERPHSKIGFQQFHYIKVSAICDMHIQKSPLEIQYQLA